VESLAEVHAVLARFWAAADWTLRPLPSEEWRHLFTTAVAEIATNIVRHAYPTREGTMQVVIRADNERVVATFTDRGVVFVMPDLSKRTQPIDCLDVDDVLGLPEGGYGLAIAQAALDELTYRREPDGVNRWRLVKRLPPDSPGDVGTA